MTASVGLNKPKRSRRGIAKKAVALALAGFLVGTTGYSLSLVSEDTPFAIDAAEAVTNAYGMGGGYPGGNNSGYSVGNFNHSGSGVGFVYCLEMGLSAPAGNPAMSNSSTAPAYQHPGQVFIEGRTYNGPGASAMSGNNLRYMNYILERWGQTNSNSQAAAVQLAVWELRRSGGNSEFVRMLNDFRSAWPGQASTADNYISIARNEAQAPPTQGSLQIRDTGPYSGTVTIPANANFVQLSNAVFTDTGSSTRSWANGLNSSTTLAWEGRPPAGWTENYRVGITGTYLYEVTPASLRIGNPGGGNQRLVTHTPPVNETRNFAGQYADPSTLWSPTLTSQVPNEFVQEGESFDDTITFGVADGSNPWRWEWRSGNRSYAPITAVGTLYGPFDTNPESNSSTDPPEDAPVAATATATTSTSQGPGTYGVDIEGEAIAAEAGFYSWVWEIRFEDQLPGIQNPSNGFPSIPENYYFTDGFGTVNETQIVPNELEISTELVNTAPMPLSDEDNGHVEVVIGDEFFDQVTAESINGDWMREDNGNFKPYDLIGTVYGSHEEPVQSATAPADAEVITTTTLTIEQPGVPTLTDPIRLPILTEHDWITVQFCVVDGQDFVVVTCDDYGVPAETAQVVRPSVETQAQEEAGTFSEIHDVAFVEGPLPDLPVRVAFEGFLRVEAGEPKYDEDWNIILDENDEPVLWTEEEVNALLESGDLAYCEAQRVATTDPVAVDDGPGAYTSPDVFAYSAGTFYWVEELQIQDPDTDEWVTVTRGECGIPNETTNIEDPTVTTQAVEHSATTDYIYDVALVEGHTPTAPTQVSFEGFLRVEAGEPKYDENWNPVYETEQEPVLDDNGEPVLDEDGNPVLEGATVPVLDEDGEPVLDENGDPVVEPVLALDEDGEPIPVYWTQEEVDALLEEGELAYCEAQPVASTDPVEVNGAGEYQSPNVIARTTGTFYWVETLESERPDNGEWEELHRGECGLPNETTIIEDPSVHTKAVESAEVGEEIWDTAIVTGPLAEREQVTYEVTFQAYHRSNPDAAAVCTADTFLFESDVPTPVTGEGEFESERWVAQEEWMGEVLWVETLWEIEVTDEGENVREVHRGECGDEDEITEIMPSSGGLLSTASAGNMQWAIPMGIFLLLIGAAGITLAIYNSRRAEQR